MVNSILQKGIHLLLRRQTNIISAAFIIMITALLSQLLGVLRYRLLVAIFGASNIVGDFLASDKVPNLVFQSIIAAAIASAFIPVFSDYLVKKKEKEAFTMASSLLVFCLGAFFVISLIIAIFAPFFLQLLNPGNGFTPKDMELMVNLMRIIMLSQLLFIIGIFFQVLLQSYNHFFIPGLALASFNLGSVIGIIMLHSFTGIYSAAYGVLIGSVLFILVQIPVLKTIRFRFKPSLSFQQPGVLLVIKLMWPRALASAVFYLSTLVTISLVSFLHDSSRNYGLFDYAQTLAFAPVVLFGQAIAQAAFPVLSREKERLEEFKITFITSFQQMLYLVLPVSILMLVLRIPIVRLIYGTGHLDWDATVLIGRTLAFFSISIFAQALINLVARAFYALHDTKLPLLVGIISTLVMLLLSSICIIVYRSGIEQIALPYSFFHGFWRGRFIFSFGIEGIAFAYSLASFIQLLILLMLLGKKTSGFNKQVFLLPIMKIAVATFFTGIAVYIPIKLLDRLVFDTTKTVNLLMLTGISSFAGLSLYLFLTWLFNVKEAVTFLFLFKKMGNWREILAESKEPLDGTQQKP